MADFPNNSSRAGEPVPPEVDKQIEKIISGEAIVRKPSRWHRFRSSFIAGDASSVGEHVLWNLLIPALKDAASDMGSTFIDMMIYGEKRGNRFIQSGNPGSGVGSTSQINYGSISTGSRLVRGPGQNNPIIEHQRRFSPNDVIVPSRAEAEGIILKMAEILEMYHFVSVSDLYRMVGVSPEYTDSKWGWKNLDSADIRRVRDGVQVILPPPQDLG
jgi:hypothetical protein